MSPLSSSYLSVFVLSTHTNKLVGVMWRVLHSLKAVQGSISYNHISPGRAAGLFYSSQLPCSILRERERHSAIHQWRERHQLHHSSALLFRYLSTFHSCFKLHANEPRSVINMIAKTRLLSRPVQVCSCCAHVGTVCKYCKCRRLCAAVGSQTL